MRRAIAAVVLFDRQRPRFGYVATDHPLDNANVPENRGDPEYADHVKDHMKIGGSFCIGRSRMPESGNGGPMFSPNTNAAADSYEPLRGQ